MSTLEINRKALFSWKFELLQNGAPTGSVEGLGSREKSILTIGDSKYELSRDTSKIDGFNLEANGTRLAHIEKPKLLTRVFNVEHAGRSFKLKHPSLFSGKYVLVENEQVVATVSPKGLFKRSAVVENAGELPTPFMLFLGWVALVLWKRQSDADSATAGAGV